MKKKSYQTSAVKRHAAVNFILFFIGFATVAAAYAVFRKNIGYSDGGMLSASAESYELFFRVSLAVSALLLLLTLLSRTISSLNNGIVIFGKIIASVSPTVCQILIMLISFFYAYVTSGGAVNTVPYVLLTGLGEAFMFTLPAAISVIWELYGKRKK